MKVETFQAMGAVPVKDGIVFSMERKNNEEASLLLYKKGSKEVIQVSCNKHDWRYRLCQSRKNSICTI